MIVHQIPVGPMQNFSYIVVDESTSESIIIDPSWNLMELELIIKNNNLKINILLTPIIMMIIPEEIKKW